MPTIVLKLGWKAKHESLPGGNIRIPSQGGPFAGGDEGVEYVCGHLECRAPLFVGAHPYQYTRPFRGSRVTLECHKCSAGNDITPAPDGSDDPEAVIMSRLQDLLLYAIQCRNELMQQYGHIKGDPRTFVGDSLYQVVSATFLIFKHAQENFSRDQWWRENGFGGLLDAGQVPDAIKSYVTLGTGSLLFFSFSLFESGLRRVVRGMDPAACGGGTAAFKNIYDWLLARLPEGSWAYTTQDATAFLDVFRNFRNTFHNNGTFYHEKGKNITVLWRGTEYHFIHGVDPTFTDWDFNFLLLKELITLNREIMAAVPVAAVSHIP